MKYSLLIRRYNVNTNHDTLDALRDELRRYFTKVEQRSGIVERLTTFRAGAFRDGMAKNSYQDMEVYAYKEDVDS